MSDFWQYIRHFFKSAEKASAQNPLIHELIRRDAIELEDYEHWKKTRVSRGLLDWVHQQYIIYQADSMETDDAIDFLRTPSAKGFVIYFRRMRYSKRDILHFFDLLKEKTSAQNYRSYVSDIRTYPRGKWIESIQRHYLKPRKTSRGANSSTLINQQFGNINIEICIRNKEVWNLKFSAISYKDRMYEEAADFGELITLLCIP